MSLNINTSVTRVGAKTLFHKRFMTNKSHLISQPFNTENTRIIRESNKKFPPPKFISFDLFGTLYKPKKSVPEQYYEISHDEFGINKSIELIKADFPKVYKQMQHEFPNYGKGRPQFEHCDLWWQELVIRLYNLDRHDDEARALCHRLIHHFTSKEAYDLYPDVVPTLEGLKRHGVKVFVASNSDLRALTILESLGIKQFFQCMENFHCSNIFLSYDYDIGKPEKTFFDKVALQAYRSKVDPRYRGRTPPVDYLSGCWHVGDDHGQDFIAAIRAGWNGVLLDRDGTNELSEGMRRRNKPEHDSCYMSVQQQQQQQQLHHTNGEDELDGPLILANNRIVISSLDQLLVLFDWE